MHFHIVHNIHPSSARPHGVGNHVFPSITVLSCQHHIRHSFSTQPGLHAVQHFFSLLPLLLFLSSLPMVRKCSKPSLLITWRKNDACCFLIYCTNDLLVSASFNTISFVFFAVHGMRNILLRNHISTASNLL